MNDATIDNIGTKGYPVSDMYKSNRFYDSMKSIADLDLNFKYNTSDEFNKQMSNLIAIESVNISVFHVNIRSLNKNDSKLYNFLLTLDLVFDVIVLSEIWDYNLELSSKLFSDYSFYYDSCTSSHVGGVGVLVKNNLICNKLDNLKIESTSKNTVENVWLEILNGKQKYILGALYRHPNQTTDDFNEIFSKRLTELRNSHIPCIIAGDINIDLCKYSVHNPTTDYVNSLIINNFLPVTMMPTRITETSASIIDHIYYYEGINGKRDLTTTSGNLWCDVTDHLPNYFIISEKVKKATTDNDRPLIRLYSAKNMRHFQYMTANTEWGDIYATSSVNEAYSLFETKINGCYNASFPQVKLSRKRARDKKWMTPGLKICSKKK